VWYFAYGSNMQRATFTGRRGIAPIQALAARAPGWRLVLDKPAVIPTRHGMANIVPAAGEEVLGVLYEITPDDMAHVELTEGVLIGSYARITLPVVPLAGGAPIVAESLASDRHSADLRPSRTYLALLIEGAEEHGLPSWWIDGLRAVPAEEDGPEERALRLYVDEALHAMRRPGR
jgi:hypothetical protein